MYTYSIIISKIARKINRNVDFPGFFKLSIRLSVNPHWKLRLYYIVDEWLSQIGFFVKSKKKVKRKHKIAPP